MREKSKKLNVSFWVIMLVILFYFNLREYSRDEGRQAAIEDIKIEQQIKDNNK